MKKPIAILLCAGYGTRMGELCATTPKPLLPVAGKPMLDYLLDQLLALPGLGQIHVVSNSHYFSAFEDWAFDWQARLSSRQPELMLHNDGSLGPQDRRGAVGDLAFLLRCTAAPSGALIAAGDNIFRFSLLPLWQDFVDSGRSHVLALEETDRERLQRTGVLELDEERRVLRLHEKPKNPPSNWACPSLYCLRDSSLQEVVPYLAADNPSDEIGRFIAHLVLREPVYAHLCRGSRLHVGSPAAYHHANSVLESIS